MQQICHRYPSTWLIPLATFIVCTAFGIWGVIAAAGITKGDREREARNAGIGAADTYTLILQTYATPAFILSSIVEQTTNWTTLASSLPSYYESIRLRVMPCKGVDPCMSMHYGCVHVQLGHAERGSSESVDHASPWCISRPPSSIQHLCCSWWYSSISTAMTIVQFHV